MNDIVIVIYFLQLFCQVLSTLPAPVNLTVDSLNFEYNLRWDPGPRTPPGTTYRIEFRPCRNKQMPLHVSNSSAVLVKQTLQDCIQDIDERYTIKVQAVHHNKSSRWTRKEFTPSVDTYLGPPEVTVSGCGNCLNLTITLPRGNASVPISEIYYIFRYHISWKATGEREVWSTSTTENSLVLSKLKKGVEYCVQVDFKLNVNRHTLPSGWVCAYTSPRSQSPESWKVIPVLACASGLLVLGGLALLGLIYTGILCKLKMHLPRVLSLVASQPTCHFIVEGIMPDTVVCDAGGNRKGTGEVARQPGRDGSGEGENDEDEEEEDATGDSGYENRMAHSLEGSSSGTASLEATGSASTATTALSAAESSGNTGAAGEEPQLEEPPGGDGFLGLSTEGEELQETRRETVDGDTDPGGDVNLLTVMLGAEDDQSAAEETEELCWWQPLLSTGSGDGPDRLVGPLADRQTDGPDLLQAAPLLTLPDCGQTDTHCFQRHANWTEEEEEEEEEEEDEECSGYMRR